ncbi:MAG: hypothetical protein WKG00_34200 [Polyangiaceae bacterium]
MAPPPHAGSCEVPVGTTGGFGPEKQAPFQLALPGWPMKVMSAAHAEVAEVARRPAQSARRFEERWLMGKSYAARPRPLTAASAVTSVSVGTRCPTVLDGARRARIATTGPRATPRQSLPVRGRLAVGKLP